MEETKPFIILKEVVKIAFERVKDNKGIYGIDKQSITRDNLNRCSNYTGCYLRF